jgi:hypothetical protein
VTNLVGLAVTFVVVCGVTAFVCTAVKEDEDAHLWRSAGRLFGFMVGGIAAFAVVVQVVTLLAAPGR